MTEEEWLAGRDPKEMLACIGVGPTALARAWNCREVAQATDRKLRLFSTAWLRMNRSCFRWSEGLEQAVTLAERFADGEVTQEEWNAAQANGWMIVGYASRETAWISVQNVEQLCAGRGESHHQDELKARCSQLLGHIIGNPFRSPTVPDHWSSTIVELAHTLYKGQDCGFALHDALLDAGHPDLADHFRQEQWHPKGCWALDAILEKE